MISPGGPLTALRKAAVAAVRRPGAVLEIGLAALLYYRFASDEFLRSQLALLAAHVAGSGRALLALLQVDALGTIGSVGNSVATLIVSALPLAVLTRRWRGWEWLRIAFWLPILAFLWPLSGATAFGKIAITSGLVLVLMRWRWLRWTVWIPLIVLGYPAVTHIAGGFAWSRPGLFERCLSNDGTRPANLTAEHVSPAFMGVSAYSSEELLLAGMGPQGPLVGAGSPGPLTGRSSWLRRYAPGRWRFDAPSSVDDMYWKGCRIGDELWVAQGNKFVGVRRDARTGAESVRRIEIEPAAEIEVTGVVCDTAEDRVYTIDGVEGGAVWELAAASGDVRKLADRIGGLPPFAQLREAGQLIIANGTDFAVYSIKREEIVQRTPAAVQMFLGVDVCPIDRQVASADLHGRVRFFDSAGDEEYRFSWGISLRAPRLLAYSPDCRHVVVSSLDDETIWIVDRTRRTVVAEHRVGPALRGTTFLSDREFAIADACTASFFAF
jgi:hypothetical protein